MRSRLFKHLSVLVSIALFANLFAASLIVQAESDDTNTQTTTNDDDGSSTNQNDDDCPRLKQMIADYEAKIKANSDTGSDVDVERLKKELEELKEKYRRCADGDRTPPPPPPRDGDRPDDPDRDEDDDCPRLKQMIADYEAKIEANSDNGSDVDVERLKKELEELKEKYRRCSEDDDRPPRPEDQEGEDHRGENCNECAELRLQVHEAKQAAQEKWNEINQYRAKIKSLMDDDTVTDADIEALKEEAQTLYNEWKELEEKVRAAIKALEECAQELSEDCTDERPRIRDEEDDSRLHDRATATIFVQWGNISEPKRDQEDTEWNVTAKIDDGKIKAQTVLFESNDEEIETDSDSAVAFKSKIAGHWDGLRLHVMPGSKASEFVIHAGDFAQVYKAADLYDLSEQHTLDNGMEVYIRSTVRGLAIAKGDYEEQSDRQGRAHDRLYKLDRKIRELGDKAEDKAREHFQKFRDETEEYLVPEGGEEDFDKALAECEELLNDDEATAEDIDACEDKVKDLRGRQRSSKFNQGLIPFPDVDDNDWFVGYVRFAKDNKIVSGFEDGSFGPGKNATRAELLKMAMEASGEQLDEGGEDNPSDSRDHWARRYIAKALKKKIASGFNDGQEFRPNERVTRAQALKIIFNALSIQVPDCEESAFSDTNDHWSECIVAYAVKLGIVEGNPDGTFAPDEPITRAAIAKIIKNAVDYARSEQSTDDGTISDDEAAEVEDELFGDDNN